MPPKKRTETPAQVNEIEVVLLGIEPCALLRFALLGVVREEGPGDGERPGGPQDERLGTADGGTRSTDAPDQPQGFADLELIHEPAACALLGVRANTLRYYRKRGKLQAYRIGGRVLYSRQQLLDFLAAHAITDGPSSRERTDQ